MGDGWEAFGTEPSQCIVTITDIIFNNSTSSHDFKALSFLHPNPKKVRAWLNLLTLRWPFLTKPSHRYLKGNHT